MGLSVSSATSVALTATTLANANLHADADEESEFQAHDEFLALLEVVYRSSLSSISTNNQFIIIIYVLILL